MLLTSIFYFACIVIAGRKYRQEQQSSLDFLAGAVLVPVAICVLVLVFSLLKSTGTANFGLSLDFSLSFLLFFIPFVLCLTNKRTNHICPRCSHIHQMTSQFERFIGILKDFDLNETGCRECDYLPSRDRVITIEWQMSIK